MKNRSVYLFGAGFSIPWGGPKTIDLTNTIRKVGFKNENGIFITDEIYLWLTEELKVQNDLINFETILNVIEDFIHFWNFDQGNGSNGLIPFISKTDEKWSRFLGFELDNEKNEKVDLIPYNSDEFTQERLKGVPISQKESKFLEVFYIKLLSIIVGQISKYSCLTKTLDKIGNSRLTNRSAEYFNEKSKSNLLRVYSLNYDRIPQEIFNHAKIPAFQGFNSEELIPTNYQSKLDSTGILTRFDENSIYNLHGSLFWEIENFDEGFEFFLSNRPSSPVVTNANLNGNFSGDYEIERNRKIIVSSIVTGYQKTLRTSLSPFRQMMSSFDRDCLTCHELIIVGYSFGDLHINDIVINSLKQNPYCKLIIVEPNEELVYNFLKTHSQKWRPKGVSWGYKKSKYGGRIIEYTRANLIHYVMGLEEFLEVGEM